MDDKIKNTLQSSKAINAARRAPVIEKAIKYTGEALKQVEKAEAQQVANNPYYQHMPKDSAAEMLQCMLLKWAEKIMKIANVLFYSFVQNIINALYWILFFQYQWYFALITAIFLILMLKSKHSDYIVMKQKICAFFTAVLSSYVISNFDMLSNVTNPILILASFCLAVTTIFAGVYYIVLMLIISISEFSMMFRCKL